MVVAIICVGHSPEGVAYDSRNGGVYVANNSDNTVSAIATTGSGSNNDGSSTSRHGGNGGNAIAKWFS